MTYRIYSSFLGLILLLCLSNITFAKKQQPNVVLVVIDDLGWKDLGCYNSSLYETPAIDKLCSEGVQFTDSYSSHPMCIGSRFSIMTGKYMARNLKSKEYGIMDLKEFTIAEAMKVEGYKTFFAGKWHLGNEKAYPQHQGFDINVAGHHKGSPGSYFYPYKRKGKPEYDTPGLDDGKEGEYITDRLTTETVRFIKKNRKKPFFVMLSHYAVHTPFESKTDLKQKYDKKIKSQNIKVGSSQKVWKADEKLFQDNATYAGMIESVDQSIARIEAQLKKLKLDDNTIVILTSDNGGDACKMGHRGKSTSNLPLKAGKCWLYEGGIRIPLIVKWPNKIRPAKSSHMVCNVDLYPTILDLVKGKEYPNQYLDGTSFSTTLLKGKSAQRKPIYWHFNVGTRLQKIIGMPKATAMRDGKYKLIEWYESGNYELYDIESDIYESQNLKDEKPELAKSMLKQLREWRKEVKAPN
ncbi:sulfatase [Halosquirtibacter xylanolyticus]|uniref:sulfatase n=1 Tax=Halosquirtibacter xylanolyticus TaxID=3374599 RepID=UPI0037480D2D|nr:sulfatase [Prolixibacteraceae bacterium]